MTPSIATARLHGLDLLRAAAILLVLMTHYAGFVSGEATFGVVGKVDWAGVDLFFVLSGYLIGNQLLAPAARGERLPLKAFFIRRLLRTLPNYYVVLAVYLLFPGPPLGGASMPRRGASSRSPRISASPTARRSRIPGRCASRNSSTCCCPSPCWRWPASASPCAWRGAC